MVSLSIPVSTPFLCSKSAVAAFPPPPPPMCVRFCPSHRVSAAYTTAERTTTTTSRPHVSHYRIATVESLYEVLGTQMDASCQEIKSAYRRLARVLHPDVASNGQKDTSAAEFIRINTAYATLSDPQKRADYDRSLFRQRRPVSSPFATSPSSTVVKSSSASRFSGYTRRAWETDQCW